MQKMRSVFENVAYNNKSKDNLYFSCCNKCKNVYEHKYFKDWDVRKIKGFHKNRFVPQTR